MNHDGHLFGFIAVAWLTVFFLRPDWCSVALGAYYRFLHDMAMAVSDASPTWLRFNVTA